MSSNEANRVLYSCPPLPGSTAFRAYQHSSQTRTSIPECPPPPPPSPEYRLPDRQLFVHTVQSSRGANEATLRLAVAQQEQEQNADPMEEAAPDSPDTMRSESTIRGSPAGRKFQTGTQPDPIHSRLAATPELPKIVPEDESAIHSPSSEHTLHITPLQEQAYLQSTIPWLPFLPASGPTNERRWIRPETPTRISELQYPMSDQPVQLASPFLQPSEGLPRVWEAHIQRPRRHEGLSDFEICALQRVPFTMLRHEGGEEIIARILQFAAQTVDVISRRCLLTDTDPHVHNDPLNTNNEAQQAIDPNGFVMWRKETKLRLVCRHWKALIEDRSKVNLHATPTDTVRISDRYIHDHNIPQSLFVRQCGWEISTYNYQRLQISFVSIQSCCSNACSDRAQCVQPWKLAFLPPSIRVVELRFPPRRDRSDESPHVLCPDCYFTCHSAASIPVHFDVVFKFPYFRENADSSWIKLLQRAYAFHEKPLLPRKQVIVSIEAWRTSQLAAIPTFLSAIVETFTSGGYSNLDFVLEFPPKRKVRDIMLREWKRHTMQRVQPLVWSANELWLININTECYHWLFYLAHIVPSGIRSIVVGPPEDRLIAYRRGFFSCYNLSEIERDDIRIEGEHMTTAWSRMRVDAWEAANREDEFDYMVFHPCRAMRDEYGLRIKAPGYNTSHAITDLNDSAACREEQATAIEAIARATAGRIDVNLHESLVSPQKRPQTNRIMPYLDAHEEIEIRKRVRQKYHSQYNCYVGEIQSWPALTSIGFLIYTREGVRLNEWKALHLLESMLLDRLKEQDMVQAWHVLNGTDERHNRRVGRRAFPWTIYPKVLEMVRSW